MKDIDTIRAALQRYVGGATELWSYTVSHGRLEIRIRTPHGNGNLHLICLDAYHISGPFRWVASNLRIEQVAYNGDDRIRISDESAAFTLICGSVAAAENVEPAY